MRQGDAWLNALDAYRAYIDIVRDAIPATFLLMPSPHDGIVCRVGWCGPKLLEVQVAWYCFVFTNGNLHKWDTNVMGDSWLYHEVHPAKGGGGELHVMLQNSDLMISASEVAVWDSFKRNWIIGDEPAMIAPYK